MFMNICAIQKKKNQDIPRKMWQTSAELQPLGQCVKLPTVYGAKLKYKCINLLLMYIVPTKAEK